MIRVKPAVTTNMVKDINALIKSMDQDIRQLYDSRSLEIMQTAENAFERGANRIKEIKNFARKAGIKKIGIAHCVAFPNEAETVKKFLSDEFEVFAVDCKCGKLTKKEMFGTEGKGILCNPAGQARILEENQTGLNISMGLCVGHDMVFNMKSAAPVTVLIVKDRVNKYNPMDSLKNISEEN